MQVPTLGKSTFGKAAAITIQPLDKAIEDSYKLLEGGAADSSMNSGHGGMRVQYDEMSQSASSSRRSSSRR